MLFQGGAGIPVIIRVTNFQAISSNQVVNIHLPNILVHSSAFTITISTVSLQNRIRTQLNAISILINTIVAGSRNMIFFLL